MVTELVRITAEQEQELKATDKYLEKAQEFSIATVDDYHQAGEELKIIKAKSNDLEKLRKDITRPLDESKKNVMALFRPALEKLDQAEKLIKKQMLIFQQEQEHKRREQEELLRKQAEAEQRRREKLAERQAEKARERGDEERAQEILDNVPNIPLPSVQAEEIKSDGISTRKVWKAKVTNFTALVQACLDNPEWLGDGVGEGYIIPNEKLLGEIARSTKGTVKIPGVDIYSYDTVAAGR